MSHSYPSDISREQFTRILPDLESARRRTKPRTVDLYDVFCGVLYLLKSPVADAPWDFPNCTCYQFSSNGASPESILQVLKKIGWQKQWSERAEQLLHRGPQSVKNTDSAEQKGYDAGKKVSGIKRHIAVDTQGLPHAVHVTTANVTDRAGALAMFDQHRDGLSLVQNVLVDGGYTGEPFAAGVQSPAGSVGGGW